MTNKDKLTEIEAMMQEESDSGPNGIISFIGELIKITLISLAIIMPVRYFLVKPFYVNGASMEPSYYNHEYLIVDEISYRFGEPKRGDVIVFKYPKEPDEFFIKRVIALPGERVVISGGDIIVYNSNNVNGFTLEESYLSEGIDTPGNVDMALKEKEYFVLGDNRNASLDSRRFGPLKEDNIIGKAWIRMLPVDRIGVLQNTAFEQ